jgi:hypothetical protein
MMALAACSGLQVETEFDPQADFSGLETYAWAERGKRGGEARAPVDRYIKTVVDRELAAKGYQKASSDPDFLVGYFAVSQAQMAVTNLYDYWGYGGGYTRTQDVSHYQQGALIVGVIDPATTQLLWTGLARDAVDDPSFENISKLLDKAIPTMFEEFPPEE